MKISLENAVKAISEYLTEEFSKMPKDFNDAWMNAYYGGIHVGDQRNKDVVRVGQRIRLY